MGQAKIKGVILIPTSQNWHSPSKGPFFRPFLFPPKKSGPHSWCHRLTLLVAKISEYLSKKAELEKAIEWNKELKEGLK